MAAKKTPLGHKGKGYALRGELPTSRKGLGPQGRSAALRAEHRNELMEKRAEPGNIRSSGDPLTGRRIYQPGLAAREEYAPFSFVSAQMKRPPGSYARG